MECKKCSHRFTEIPDLENHVSNVYSDDYFFEGAAGYPNYLAEKNILLKTGKRYSKILAKFTKPGKVLDIGSAAGFILNGFKESGWQCHGIEPNENMALYGRNELILDIQTSDLETYKTDKKFDLISMIQVIGHFYDLDKALLNVSRFSKKNGLVLVESWNMKSAVARLLGKHWHEYSPPSVVHWFSDQTLNQLFNYYGFEIIAKGRPAKRINLRHALSFYQEKAPAFSRPIFNLLNRSLGKLTFMYPPFDLKWYLFKKLKD